MKYTTIQHAFLLILLINANTTFAQVKVGNNVSSINSNSLLELESTNKGLLLPRIALTATNSASPLTAFVAGMMVYNTATAGTSPNNVTPGQYYSDGSKWVKVQSSPVQDYDWRKSGNLSPNAISDTTTAIYHMGQVGIGTNSVNSSALLQLNSTTKGFLPPRMTSSEILSISSPTAGLTIFNTTLQCLGYFTQNGAFTCGISGTTISTPRLGSQYTTFYNGNSGGTYSVGGASSSCITHTAGESFNNNSLCSSKYISAQGCGGLSSITGASGAVYPLVDINGQCWTTKNMKEIPSAYAYHTPTSWLATTAVDSGYFGFYHTTTLNGSAGWGTTEPAAGEGYLYQWSAAMNGSTSERAKGICPTGFHIPSDCEIMYLEHGLGMSLVDQTNYVNSSASRGVPGYAGCKMGIPVCSISNTSGFTNIYAGTRYTTGDFVDRSNNFYLGSSTGTPGATTITRVFYIINQGIEHFGYDVARGLSYRCLKD